MAKKIKKSKVRRSGKGPSMKAVPLHEAAQDLPDYVKEQLFGVPATRSRAAKPTTEIVLERLPMDVAGGDEVPADLVEAAGTVNADAAVPMRALPEDVPPSVRALQRQAHRFHGSKTSLAWFRWPVLASPCADKFGYLTDAGTRKRTKLPFDPPTIALLDQLGDLMGDSGRTSADSGIPAGFTYVGQFVDHDVTLDVSSRLDVTSDAKTIRNMRSPALDLDSVYGDGPALDPYLYVFPSSGPSTAIKFQLGSNNTTPGPGGSAGSSGSPSGMVTRTDFDLPRVHNPFNPALSTRTAIIGDPRNDENLIVSQLHYVFLRLHNKVVDALVAANFQGDIFVEARKLVTHHYQWAVVNDFLVRVCGKAAVDQALNSAVAPIGSYFEMPAEFAMAAYRFGHSMVRETYWINFNFPGASLSQVFQFIRNPQLPLLSSWVVDFNAFFSTGFSVPINNKARKIDSVLANGLESLPGFSGLMQVLAKRNLRRGLALGLPSGQGVAKFFNIPPLTATQLQQGLPPDEVALLSASGGLLLKKTPLWYYVLREAAVLNNGDQLGPVGARIVAETFVRILTRDATSYLNTTAQFVPTLPSATTGTFTFADIVNFAGVTKP